MEQELALPPPRRSTGGAGALLSPPRRSERVTSRHNYKHVNDSGFNYAIEEDIPPEPDPFSESELAKFAYSCIQADRASATMTDLFDATVHSLYSDDAVFGTVSYNAAQKLFSKNTTDDSLDLELKVLIDSDVFKPYAYGDMSPRERKFALRSFAIFFGEEQGQQDVPQRTTRSW